MDDIVDHLQSTQLEDIFHPGQLQPTQSEDISHPIMPTPTNHMTEREGRFKYIDDLSLCHSIDLCDLKPFSSEMEKPLNYRDRTNHYLPTDKNPLQKSFNNVHNFCQIQKCLINDKKSKTVIFNTSYTKDFTPRILNNTGTLYDNTENFQLLGVDFETDKKKGLTLDNYINRCIQRAYANKKTG